MRLAPGSARYDTLSVFDQPEIEARHVPTLLKRPRVQRYGLAVVSVAVALGAALWLNRYNVGEVEFPLFLLAIAVSAWYAGTAPAILTLLLSSLAFNYFYTEPLYSFEVAWVDVPHLVVFVLFASLLTWFSAVRRRIEQRLLQSNDHLEGEVAERTRQAALLEQTAIEIRTLNQDLEARSRELRPFALRL
jgi:K+-sensing histidine kinase KdpD